MHMEPICITLPAKVEAKIVRWFISTVTISMSVLSCMANLQVVLQSFRSSAFGKMPSPRRRVLTEETTGVKQEAQDTKKNQEKIAGDPRKVG